MLITAKTMQAAAEAVRVYQQRKLSTLHKFALLAGSLCLLGSTGCVFRDGGDHPRDPGHHQVEKDSDRSGVDHEEFPGDQDHNQNQ